MCVCEQDTYCSVPVVAVDGTCPSGVCARCGDALARFYQLQPPASYGHYPQGCLDGVGYTWAACDADALPANAVWTSNSLTVGDRRGCAWGCSPLKALPWNGGCLPCFSVASAQLQCVVGQVLRACAAGGYAACQPCTGPLPNSLMAWTSNAPYFTQCSLDCENGIAFRADANASNCKQCSRIPCPVGGRYVPCTVTNDAACASCPAPPANEEWFTPGSCLTRCVAGYYRAAFDGSCAACALAAVCPGGQYPSSLCADPSDRLEAPTCLPCPPPPGMSAVALAMTTWVTTTTPAGGCARQCLSGFVPGSAVPRASVYWANFSALPCVRCDPGLCGQAAVVGLCDSGLVCRPCVDEAPPEGMRYDPLPQALNAGVYACAQLWIAGMPSPTPSTAAAAAAAQKDGSTVDATAGRRMGGYARPGLVYPKRA